MSYHNILLVDENASDDALTLRALKKNNIQNEVVVMRDGAAALDWLFARGAHTDRASAPLPQLVLLDLQLPKIGGLDVLRAIRADERTKLLLVVILTSSKQDQDLVDGYGSGANSYVIKPVDFVQFAEAVRNLGLYWLVINERPPAPR
jgi:CheY-like chemotaxis protein